MDVQKQRHELGLPGRYYCFLMTNQPLDKNGMPITEGLTVRTPDGFTGIVVLANCALRVDVSPDRSGLYLQYNSSLLFCDRWKPRDFEVIG